MKLWVNGEEYDGPPSGSLAGLLEELGAKIDRVAVLVNGDVVPGPARNAFRLAAGDRVEIFTFVAGG